MMGAMRSTRANEASSGALPKSKKGIERIDKVFYSQRRRAVVFRVISSRGQPVLYPPEQMFKEPAWLFTDYLARIAKEGDEAEREKERQRDVTMQAALNKQRDTRQLHFNLEPRQNATPAPAPRRNAAPVPKPRPNPEAPVRTPRQGATRAPATPKRNQNAGTGGKEATEESNHRSKYSELQGVQMANGRREAAMQSQK